MQKNNELTEKEIIIENLKNSNNLKETAIKCGFTIPTLLKRLEKFDLNHSFKKGNRTGNKYKVAKLG